MDADVWLFIKWVCGHGSKAVERFHRPLAYLLAGDVRRLAASLETYQSEIVSQIRAELTKREIDWRTPRGLKRLRRQLKRINDRIARSMSKTTTGLDCMLWLASRDPLVPCDLASPSGPDTSIALASKSDPVAQKKMLATIGNMMRSPEYATYYSDRLNPKNPDAWINNDWIQMAGRQTAGDQKTIEARGINSQWTGNHYDVIYADDIVGTESGEASTEDAIRWIAALHGISKSEALGGTRHIFNGTIYGPKDDNAVLVINDEFLSTRIPIWKKTVPSTVANIPVDGVPVLPEWYSVEDIKRIRKETLSSNTVGSLGAISWLQNFELTAHEEGAMSFTVDLLKRQFFLWIDNPKTRRREMRRYLWGRDEKGNPTPKVGKDNKASECLCWMQCGNSAHEYVQFDPLTLPRRMGIDQAIAKGGDDWGVGASCIDPMAHVYQLRGEYAKGYWLMVPAISTVFKRWGGMDNPVAKIGCESNTWQSISADWMKREPELQFLARQLEKLPPTQTAKVMRIYNDVYANLMMGTLWLDPEDSIFQRCALKYNAADPDTQWDDPLDSVAMSIQLHTSAASDLTEEAMNRLIRQQERDYADSHDIATGIDYSSSFVEAMW